MSRTAMTPTTGQVVVAIFALLVTCCIAATSVRTSSSWQMCRVIPFSLVGNNDLSFCLTLQQPNCSTLIVAGNVSGAGLADVPPFTVGLDVNKLLRQNGAVLAAPVSLGAMGSCVVNLTLTNVSGDVADWTGCIYYGGGCELTPPIGHRDITPALFGCPVIQNPSCQNQVSPMPTRPAGFSQTPVPTPFPDDDDDAGGDDGGDDDGDHKKHHGRRGAVIAVVTLGVLCACCASVVLLAFIGWYAYTVLSGAGRTAGNGGVGLLINTDTDTGSLLDNAYD